MKMIDEIWKFEVTIVSKKGIIRQESSFEKTRLKVLDRKDGFFVVNDDRFSTLTEDKKCRVYPSLDNASIHFYLNDRCFGTQASYTLFTRVGKRKETIQKEIQSAVNEKYGGIMSLDFSILTR
jgi:hypothetical protein